MFNKSISSNILPEEEIDLKNKIADACVYMHTSLIKASEKFYNEHKRYCFVTPSCFIDLLKTFAKMFESKKIEYLVNIFLK